MVLFSNLQVVADIMEEVQKHWFSSKGISSMSSQDIVIGGQNILFVEVFMSTKSHSKFRHFNLQCSSLRGPL